MYLLHANGIWHNLSPKYLYCWFGCYITMNWNSLKCTWVSFVTMLFHLNLFHMSYLYFIGWGIKWNVSPTCIPECPRPVIIDLGCYICHWPFLKKLVCWEPEGCELWTCKTPIEVLLTGKNRTLDGGSLKTLSYYLLSVEYDISAIDSAGMFQAF